MSKMAFDRHFTKYFINQILITNKINLLLLQQRVFPLFNWIVPPSYVNYSSQLPEKCHIMQNSRSINFYCTSLSAKLFEK